MTPDEVLSIVRAFERDYAAAFNRRDANALVALFEQNATIVTEFGDVVRGRAAFASGLARAFDRMPGEIALENTPSHAEAITGDVIVSHGTSRRRGASFPADDLLTFTRVLVRRDGTWRLAANHVSEASTRPDPRTGAT
jgi:uncharacterized protein (TIGR02246 family)